MPFSVLASLWVLDTGFPVLCIVCCLNSNPRRRNKNLIFTDRSEESLSPSYTRPLPCSLCPCLGLRPIPLCLIYGQIIQIKQRGACALLTLESEIRLYLLLGISRAPFKRSPLQSPPSHSGVTTMARPRAKTLMDYNEGQFLEADALNTRL